MDMVAIHFVRYEHLKYLSQCDLWSSVIDRKWRIVHFLWDNFVPKIFKQEPEEGEKYFILFM